VGFRAVRFDELEDVPRKEALAIARVPDLRREAQTDPLLAPLVAE
jgi:hypothetical protein